MKVNEPLLYFGPNRRSNKTVIEWPLVLTPGEQQAVRLAAGKGLQAVRARLDSLGCIIPALFDAGQNGGSTNEDSETIELMRWVAAISLAMQQAAGHRVEFSTVLPASGVGQCRLIFEYEHLAAGTDAGELAMRLVSESIPGLEWQADAELPGENLEDAYSLFLARAADQLLPLDAQAIIDAAERLDIPCVKLEREPYGRLEGDFRIRPNGLLKLGHSCHQHIVDGTLCVDRNPALIPLLFDREKLFRCLNELELPAPRQDREFRHLISAKRAIRVAERIGYPVVVKPAARCRVGRLSPTQVFSPLTSAAEVRLAFEQSRERNQKVIVEQYVAGSTFHLLLANHEPICVSVPDGSPLSPSVLHDSILEMAERVSRALDTALLCITLVTPEPSRSLADAGGAVVDLDPAPRLDQLLSGDEQLMAAAAEGFVRCLYPLGAPSRIPLVAVTGTNGKTTTSRMIARIASTAGFVPGLASTSGVYFNEVLHQSGDQSGAGGHHVVFEARGVNLGVLETARGGVAHSGFMFDWCDVAVCLNVTYDHLGQYGIDTLQQMTALKRSILERARRAVVINADYATCRDMLPFAAGIDVYLASVESGTKEIRSLTSQAHFACVLEEEDEEWIILYEPGGARIPVTPVAAIPATMGGVARFNISNAQHAVCACHALGIGLDVVRKGLSTFDARFEDNPGRLNIYRQLPFTVVLDFAHNPDGMEKLCAVIDQMKVPGRKILVFAGTGGLSDEFLKEFARSPVGHFDYFVCRNYPDLEGRKPDEVPSLMKAALLDAGVAEERITLEIEKEDVVKKTLSMAREGDLVVFSPGTAELEPTWREIISFRPEFPMEITT